MSESTFFDRTFGALLFDMDGTIINSIAAAERVWTAWAERHGLDVASFLPTIHGVRAIETITKLELPGVDPQAEVHARSKMWKGSRRSKAPRPFSRLCRPTDGPSSHSRRASLRYVVLRPQGCRRLPCW